MLSQKILNHIEILREKEVSYAQIGRSLDISATKINYNYLSHVLPFAEAFQSIVEDLELYDMAVYRKDCQDLLYRVKSSLKKNIKFLNVSLLAPVVVYVVFRSEGVIIKPLDLCRASSITLSDFREGLLVVNPFCVEYIKRNREKLVSQLINKVITKFNLDSTFENTTNKLCKTFFPLFKNTKDNIVAGLIIALSFVALDYNLQVLSRVFEALGTDITRAHYHIKRKIFLPNELGDFKGFVTSKEQLRRFLLTKILTFFN